MPVLDARGHIAIPNLREWRTRAGMTRQVLANKAGLSEATLAKLERGKSTSARLATAEKLARALRISVDRLTSAPADPKDSG